MQGEREDEPSTECSVLFRFRSLWHRSCWTMPTALTACVACGLVFSSRHARNWVERVGEI